MMRFAPAQLVALRMAAGYPSQKRLAAALGVSHQTVNNWESGRYAPSGPLVVRLVQVLRCQIGDLFVNDSQDHDTASLTPTFKAALYNG
jgi:DNA-binding XRE family transcriptional regulator